MIRTAYITLLTLGLSGCASSLSGVGGTQNYACKAPIGALCTSVSGVYANALHGMAEVPRPPLTTAAPKKFGDTNAVTKDASLISGAEPLIPSRSPTTADLEFESLSATTFSASAQPDSGASGAEPALRSEPRVLRLWIAPWEDSDGDLHDAALVHVVVDTGRWLIERVRPVPRNRLGGITPPTAMALPPQTPADQSPQITPAQQPEDDTLFGPGDLSVEP
ncbi:MAG: type IV conjugative transfer system lipoprotein TraV [Gammaproteobacteria bacterium]|nr:type IV conjugative transfer system lipoprotein TraV [Gammaproteobacteria bacterium]